MSEAIISRRGYNSAGKPTLVTETIISNTTWKVPNHYGNISVMIFGGGGGGCGIDQLSSTGQQYTYAGSGGGGGWMNNGEFSIQNKTSVSITIGKGGQGNNGGSASAGGTSSFGTYLSANGGGGPS